MALEDAAADPDLRRRNLLLGSGAFLVYCVSCTTMLVMAGVAVAAILGLGTARMVSTPLDGFLAVAGVPLLILSLLLLGFAVRRRPWPLPALVATGGLLTILAMLLMPARGHDESSMEGMGTSMDAAGPSLAELLTATTLFLFGAGLLILALFWLWRAPRPIALRRPLRAIWATKA